MLFLSGKFNAIISIDKTTRQMQIIVGHEVSFNSIRRDDCRPEQNRGLPVHASNAAGPG